MSGHFIGKNSRLIYDILHYSQCEDIPGLLMLIDFQKAFDSVSWKFLNSTLKFFGFKKGFCKWIQVLNTNIKASVLLSGFLFEFIDIERRCHQGDPILSRMFIICAQVMLLLILNNKSIKGISVNGIEQIITQFADDTTLILDGSKESLVVALNTLEIFGSMSGLKINTNKTKLIWIGKKTKLIPCATWPGVQQISTFWVSIFQQIWNRSLSLTFPQQSKVLKNVACLASKVSYTNWENSCH